MGLVMQEDLEEICERLCGIEEALGVEEGVGGNSENPRQSRHNKRKKNLIKPNLLRSGQNGRF